MPKEHFTVYIGRKGQTAYRALAAGTGCYFADPFIWRHEGKLWLLVEEFEYLKNRGRLRCIPLDTNLRPGLPLPLHQFHCHASFPFVFAHGSDLYLIPETSKANCVDLFVCDEFPRKWQHERRLLEGVDAAGTVVFPYRDLWWMITSVRRNRRTQSRFLAVYYCSDFLGDRWQPHPINESRKFDGTRYSTGRNAGAVVRHGEHLLRPAQDNRDFYGQSTCVMEIDRLTPTEYNESPFAGPHVLTDLSRRFSPHHISVHGDFVAFDIRDRMSYQQYIPFWRKKVFTAAQPGGEI